MATSITNLGFPNYGTFNNATFGAFNSPMMGGTSAFGFGFSGITAGASTDSYEKTLERQRKKQEAEMQKHKQELEAREAQKEQEKLMAEMKKEASDIFPELTAEEEEILFKYLEKTNKSYNKQFTQDATESVVGIAGVATAVGVISWVGEHSHATEVLARGASSVGQGISNITPGCIKTACSSVGNGATWLAEHTGVSTINNTLNTMGYGRVAECAKEMSAEAANATGKFAKVATKVGAKTANFCNGALSKVAKLGPVVEAGKVVYEDWDDLNIAYKAGGKSAVKQTAQTGAKAGAAAAGFWAGAKGGAALGATVGGFLGPVGATVGGFIGGLVGGIAGAWGGKKLAQACVGENEGARLKREQMAKEAQEKAAAEQAKKMESYNLMLMDALTYAQTDEELDEATAIVLAKLQGRLDGSGTMTVEEQAVAAVQAQAQEQQQAQA